MELKGEEEEEEEEEEDQVTMVAVGEKKEEKEEWAAVVAVGKGQRDHRIGLCAILLTNMLCLDSLPACPSVPEAYYKMQPIHLRSAHGALRVKPGCVLYSTSKGCVMSVVVELLTTVNTLMHKMHS